MQAAVLHGKEDLRVEGVPMPVAGPGEIVVRVHAALTCGTDLKVYRRGYHAKMLKPPIPFGHELAGTVQQVGEGVTMFHIGDRVVPINSAPCGKCFYCKRGQDNLCDDLLFNNGAYAEYLRIPRRIVEINTLRIPDGLPYEYAAMTEPLACVLHGLDESGAQAGDTAAVIGAGPIGLMFMNAASAAGLHVIAAVKHDNQVEMARIFGAEQVVQITTVEDPVAAVRSLTPDGRGADLAVEAVASPITWQWAVGMARKGGVVNFFGGPPSGTRVEFDTNRLHYSDLTLKASFHHTPTTVRRAFEMIRSGKFKCREAITGRASLTDIGNVFRGMMNHHVPGVKTVIIP